MDLLIYSLPIALGITALGVFYGFYQAYRLDSGIKHLFSRIRESHLDHPLDVLIMNVANAIREGAAAYLSRQYSYIAAVGLVLMGGTGWLLGWTSALSFLWGAILSGGAGYVAMYVAVSSNVYTARSARNGLSSAFDQAVYGGNIISIIVVGLALLGVGVLWMILTSYGGYTDRHLLDPLLSMCFGASLVSIFARMGGGIFTKGADVGADLIGKIEQNIPEDDARNPAVIADNVGDNVGDCAGMAADLFETYVVTLVSALNIGFLWISGHIPLISVPASQHTHLMVFPILLCAVAFVINGLFGRFIELKKHYVDAWSPFAASHIVSGALFGGLNKSLIFTAFGGAALTYGLLGWNETVFHWGEKLVLGSDIFTCISFGLLLTYTLVKITEYYTGTRFRPVHQVAEASETGHGTNVIMGLAVGMQACGWPTLAIVGGILGCYHMAGVMGLAIGAISMMAMSGIIVTLDAYGPITDNAGGIVEMSGEGENLRAITDILDGVGNTTKAVTKGYAVGSAGLSALVLFTTYVLDCQFYHPHMEFNLGLQDPYVLVGLLIGGMIPFLFSSEGLKAVGKAAQQVVEEVRSQFKNNPGLITGEILPDYSRTVDVLTKGAVKAMIIPSLMPIFFPIFTYAGVKYIGGTGAGLSSLGGLLIGVVLSGLFLAIFMTTSGGVWDNAKKYIEQGSFKNHIKGSATHKAAVTGDTVGDPFKDTAGPALNVLIKLVNIVALLILASGY